MYDDDDRDFLTVAAAAVRMAVSEDEVVRLAKAGALRVRHGYDGTVEVEPAVLV